MLNLESVKIWSLISQHKQTNYLHWTIQIKKNIYLHLKLYTPQLFIFQAINKLKAICFNY